MEHNQRKPAGIDIPVILRFIVTGFVYLLAGLIIFMLNLTGIISIRADAIFILWLFGFVAMMIFGLSYMFSSGLARNSATINSTIRKEYILLNAGVIIFFSGFSSLVPMPEGKYLAIAGLLLLMVSVLIHLVNSAMIAKGRKNDQGGKKSYKDDY
ncbi:MAG: hypothetical protein M1414_03270 [Candidatus Thermoplasmatota archaeon]|jgi:hypothetical protein|nr:hypothetical protein [Candidatus Thermoplasmatota archaeon]